MSTSQMTAEMFRDLSVIAEDENLMKKVARYLRKVVEEKHHDDTLMTKDEFFTMIDQSLEQARQGRVTRQLPGESVEAMLIRSGYDI